MESLRTETERHSNTELAAYYLWEQRGCPFGSPEVDWFQAEEQGQAQYDAPDNAVLAVAKAMGAALGSVAGLVASVSHIGHTNGNSDAE